MAALTVGPVALVGLGLVGGSLARALLAVGEPVRGWTADAGDRAAAGRAGVQLADTSDADVGIAEAVRGARAVVIAVPLAELPSAAESVLAAAAGDALLLHASGLQRREAVALPDEAWARVFGTHPMAGSHARGFDAGRADLFTGCRVYLESRMPDAAAGRARALWSAAGAARFDVRDAEAHDALMVLASHLPQLASTALAATLEAQGVMPDEVGPGGRDATRLAASPHGGWDELLARAGDDLEIALAAYQGTLAALSRALVRGDRAAMSAIWERGRRWRQAAAGVQELP